MNPPPLRLSKPSLPFLARTARKHGAHARLDGDSVLVWNSNSSIRTNCYETLRQWLEFRAN